MIVYVGFATGGLWKSTDGGNHWKSQFDNMANESIGAIAIAPSDPDVVYVGMGEANNRQSSSIGDGVWGTTDGGKTWNHLGLEDTQSIGRIVVDPTNPNIVYVAAMGHLFGAESGTRPVQDRPTAARPGRSRSTSIPTPASPMWRSILRIPRSCMRRPSSGGAPGGATTAAAPAARCGRPPTAATPGPSSKDRAGRSRRTASTAASRFPIFRAKPTTIYAQVEAGASGGTGGGTGAEGGPARGGRGGFGGGDESGSAADAPDARGAAGAAAAAGGRRRRWRRRRPRRGRLLLPIPTAAACSAPTMAARPGRS